MIKFTKDSSGVYVAEFQVTDDFNLHIERKESGYLIVNQRTTAEGKYDVIRDGSFNYGDPVVDIDFTGVIYPKYIQVISKVEPTYAEVTSNGEVKQMGMEFVDLGLPSGTKWATCNLGATKPEEFGLYFAWGETQGYTGITDEKQFSWADYKWSDADGTTMTKYNETDGLTTLEASDDAATATDSSCRMPTGDELRELKANTTSKWVADYNGTGVAGRIFTSIVNGNSIFVPAAGFCNGGSVLLEGQSGNLWSSSLGSSGVDDAFNISFNSGSSDVYNGSRFGGKPIRPVSR